MTTPVIYNPAMWNLGQNRYSLPQSPQQQQNLTGSVAYQMAHQPMQMPQPQQQQQAPTIPLSMPGPNYQAMMDQLKYPGLDPVKVTASPVTGQGGSSLNLGAKLFGGTGQGSGMLGTGGSLLSRWLGAG